MLGMPEVGGLKRRLLEMAMKRLLHDGLIKNEVFGPPSRGRKRLVIIAEKAAAAGYQLRP